MRARPRRILCNGSPAPRLWVMFQCSVCHVSEVLDAYLGVPLCHNKPMEPERLVHPDDMPAEVQ